MLVAGPSHLSFSYTTNAELITHRNSTNNSNSASSNASNSNASSSVDSTVSTYSLIKTFTEQLNRGTEYLKQTVQRAILPIKKQIATDGDPGGILSPGKLHRLTISPESESCDSTKLELCHFKPIKTLPPTPNPNQPTICLLKTPQPQFMNSSRSSFSFFGGRQHRPMKSTRKFIKSATSAFSTLDEIRRVDVKESTRKVTLRKVSPQKNAPPPPVSTITSVQNRKIGKRKMSNEIIGGGGTINKHSNDSPTVEYDMSSNINTSFKRLKLEQEKSDFEFAKKLQSQLKAEQMKDGDVVAAGGRKKREPIIEQNNANVVAMGENERRTDEDGTAYNLRRKKQVVYFEPERVNLRRRSTRRK